MKREDVKKVFPEATDEQVSEILNAIGGEINPLKAQLTAANASLEGANAQLEKERTDAAAAKAQLEAANAKLQEGMSAEELLEQMRATAAEREREFSLKSNALDARAILNDAGCFDKEQIDALVERCVSEDAEATKTFAQLLVDTTKAQRTAAEQKKQDELLKGNPDLGGGGGNGGSAAPTTVKEFLTLPFSEQLALKEANPNIISELK